MYSEALIVAVLSMSSVVLPQAGPEQPTYKDLSREDIARLDRQRGVVARAAKQHYGTTALTRTKSDLSVLQHLIDDKVFSSQQTYQLQCLGIAFGDVLASEFPLHWMMVTDEFGTDPTLRFKNTSFQVNALTMISKQIEKGKPVDLVDMMRFVRESLSRVEQN